MESIQKDQQADASMEETGDSVLSRRQKKAHSRMQVTKQTCSFG
jgi:hypothetical protein